MVFLIINSIDILEEHQNVDGDHDTFVERFHEDIIDPRSHQVKRMMKQEVIGTMVRHKLEIKIVVQGELI